MRSQVQVSEIRFVIRIEGDHYLSVFTKYVTHTWNVEPAIQFRIAKSRWLSWFGHIRRIPKNRLSSRPDLLVKIKGKNSVE